MGVGVGVGVLVCVLGWVVLVCHGLYWCVMGCIGVSWVVLVCHGLYWGCVIFVYFCVHQGS